MNPGNFFPGFFVSEKSNKYLVKQNDYLNGRESKKGYEEDSEEDNKACQKASRVVY